MISKEEEEKLNKILQVYKLDISDAKAITAMLTEELVQQEKVYNISPYLYIKQIIHEIFEKQMEWRGLIAKLDVTQEQLDVMDSWLKKYNSELSVCVTC